MKLIALAVIAAIAVAGSVYHMSGQKAGAVPTPVYDSWVHWKMKHGKSYGTSAEETARLAIFFNNYQQVMTHNEAKLTWSIELGKFADMTQQEVATQYTGFRKVMSTIEAKSHLNADWETKDWRNEGAVTPVKNQGQCGSCWAFSTTGSLEGAYYNKHSTLKSFSEQQLVDCDTVQDQGCNGGLMDNAFTYIESHPLMLESEYSYVAKRHSCKYESSKGVGTVSNFMDVAHDADAMKEALNTGPVSVAIEADQMAFQGYSGGVITGSACGTNLDHGVLAVGYGTENGENYFLVKNSWGPGWGVDGYVKIGANNVCGILKSASQPTA